MLEDLKRRDLTDMEKLFLAFTLGRWNMKDTIESENMIMFVISDFGGGNN
jgi:hypothetical protein